jgi:hypothetical protein
MDGWGARAADPTGDLRWLDTTRAELVLPLDLPRDRPITITIQARTRLVDPPVPAPITVTVNGHRLDSFTADAAQPSVSTIVIPAGSDAWVRGFNRFVFEKTPPSAAPPPPVAFYRLTIR